MFSRLLNGNINSIWQPIITSILYCWRNNLPLRHTDENGHWYYKPVRICFMISIEFISVHHELGSLVSIFFFLIQVNTFDYFMRFQIIKFCGWMSYRLTNEEVSRLFFCQTYVLVKFNWEIPFHKNFQLKVLCGNSIEKAINKTGGYTLTGNAHDHF
jgi:hypothetical protein